MGGGASIMQNFGDNEGKDIDLHSRYTRKCKRI